MKIYICGPMRGYPELNFPTFHKAAKWLREVGFEVSNPAEAFEGRMDLPIEIYVRKDIDVINTWADCLVVLPGYELSEIGNLEVTLAKALRLKIYKMPSQYNESIFPFEEVTEINPVEYAMTAVREKLRRDNGINS